MQLTVILRENQADSMESQFLGYLEISQSIRKSKVLMSKTRKPHLKNFVIFSFSGRGVSKCLYWVMGNIRNKSINFTPLLAKYKVLYQWVTQTIFIYIVTRGFEEIITIILNRFHKCMLS